MIKTRLAPLFTTIAILTNGHAALAEQTCPIDNRTEYSDGQTLSEKELITYASLTRKAAFGQADKAEIRRAQGFADRLNFISNPIPAQQLPVTDETLTCLADVYQETFDTCPSFDVYEHALAVTPRSILNLTDPRPKADREILATAYTVLPVQSRTQYIRVGRADDPSQDVLYVAFNRAIENTQDITTPRYEHRNTVLRASTLVNAPEGITLLGSWDENGPQSIKPPKNLSENAEKFIQSARGCLALSPAFVN